MQKFPATLSRPRTGTFSILRLRSFAHRGLFGNRHGIFCLLALALLVTRVNRLQAPDPEKRAESRSRPARAAETFEVAGAAFPTFLVDGENTLQLVGSGVRRQLRLNMYAMALYCATGVKSDRNIIEFDRPAAIRLELVSNLISKERLEKAFTYGFQSLTIDKLKQLNAEIAQFLAAFAEPIQKEDVFEFVYQPGIGTRVVKNGQVKTTVKGAEFKQALFGIWIGETPVDQALKDQILASMSTRAPSDGRRKSPPADEQESQPDDLPVNARQN